MTVSQYSPCSTANDPSTRSSSPTPSNTPRAPAAAPANSVVATRRVHQRRFEQLPHGPEAEGPLQLAAPGREHPHAGRGRRADRPPPAGGSCRCRPIPRSAPCRRCPPARRRRHARSAVSSCSRSTRSDGRRPAVAVGGRRGGGSVSGVAGGAACQHPGRTVERRRLREHVAFQRAQCRARLDPEFRRPGSAAPGGARPAHHPAGARGTARAPADRQRSSRSGSSATSASSSGTSSGLSPSASRASSSALAGDGPQLDQPGDLGRRPRFVRVVGVGRAPPEVQRRGQAAGPAPTPADRPPPRGRARTATRPRPAGPTLRA